jgi:acyl-CoA synthetase (AMP-forming)/AMP-acid ligase II
MSEPKNITDLFFAAAEKHPDNIAIIYKKGQLTYKELAQQVKAAAGHFRSKGISAGDRVLIFVPMSIELYKTVLALLYMGATAVFLDEWVSIKRMEACCRIADCKAFIGDWKIRVLGNLLSKEIRNIPVKLSAAMDLSPCPSPWERGIFSCEEGLECASNDIHSTALITFTTGSTGTPKAAKRTHHFLFEQFKALIEKIDPQPGDVDMPVLPIVLLLNLGTGATSVIADHKASKPHTLQPAKIIAQVKKHKVNRLTSSPFFIKEVSKYIIQNNIDTSNFTKLFTGGAPVFPNEAELYAKAFPDAKFEVVYGSTEAEPISGIDVKELVKEKENVLSKGLKVGNIYHRAEVRIIPISDAALTYSEDELHNVSLAAYQPGEIIVSGHHVLREYFNNEDALKRNKIFAGDKVWHRTGDAGYLDENGVLYLTGRCNMMIAAESGYLSPFLFENFFQTIEGVSMGTIMKVKNKLRAVIELEDKSSKAFVKNKISKSAVNFDEIIFIKKMPRDPRHNSKIDYAKLKEIVH